MGVPRKRQVDEKKQIESEIEEPLLVARNAPRPEARIAAWKRLEDIIQDPELASKELIYKLLDLRLLTLLRAETDAHVLRAAFEMVLRAIVQLAKGPERPDEPRPAADLWRWLWQDFHDCSRVLRVVDPHRHRRDEDAVHEIGRSLPWTDFPHTEFPRVAPGGFAPAMVDFDAVKTLCFVGRLGLYGREAQKTWKMAKRTLRYRFGMDFRPPELPPGKLHPEYHAIVRSATETEQEKWYRTSDTDEELDKKTRTDYGLIQRYVVRWGGRSRVVIIIAGCTSLGTLAAAHFAAYTLLHPGLGDKPYILPPSANSSGCCLEILVEAVANIRGSELGWTLRELKLLDLCVDDFTWDERENSWQLPRHDVITLRFPSAAAVRNYRKSQAEVKVELDGKKINFRRDKDNQGSENWRLCVTLCMLAKKQGGQVDLSQLGGDTWIWKEHDTRKDAYVKNRLRGLGQMFGTSFEIDGDVCRVIPEIRIEIERPTKPR